jgi:transcriptional regulator with XRE-family HTH domain
MTFAEKIDRLKRHAGLSDRRLAKELEMSPKAIGNLIRRGATPRPWTARRLADFFSVGVSELLDDSVDLDLVELERRQEERQTESVRSIEGAVRAADSVRGSKGIRQVVFELEASRRRELREIISKLDALERDVIGQITILRRELRSLALAPKTENRSKG